MKAIVLMFLISSNILWAQSDAHREVQQPIREFFEGLSENDLGRMRSCVSDDFTILEHGVVWTMDTIVALTKRPRPAGFKRLNELEFFQTEIADDMAFVSYHNRAEIRTPGRTRRVEWLESAVLIRDGKRWKIKLLHSTRLPKTN